MRSLLTFLLLTSFSSLAAATRFQVEVGPHRLDARSLDSVLARRHHRRSSAHRKRAKCSARSPSSRTATTNSTNPQVNLNNKPASTTTAVVPASTKKSRKKKPGHKSTTPLYEWTDYTRSSFGVNLGSWLMLEKWMSVELFNNHAPNAVDDYTFAQATYPNTAAILKPYWESWVSNDDIDRIAAAGVNMVRVPFGYWAFHENVGGDPFPALQGQQAQITRVLKRLAKHNIHAILEFHSMPGRASIDQCNGRLNGPVQFYDDEFQQYNDASIRNLYKYIRDSPYRNNVAAIGAVNEPHACYAGDRNETRVVALREYYQRTYDFLASQADRVPLIIHHGYCGLPEWNDFIQDKDPRFLIMEDHPYPGTFVSTSSDDDALGGVCYKAQEYSRYPIPVVVTEWTLRLNVGGNDLVPRMFAQQTSAYAASGGGCFWSHKGNNDNPDGWNFLKLVESGVIKTPPNGTNVMDWATTQLGGTCTGLSRPPWAS